MTITEALAEIKTVQKRVQSKREFIKQYLTRYEGIKDPLEKDGGSAKVLGQELQAVRDLEQRVVDLRRGIQAANEKTRLVIEGQEQSIADWIVWRREVSNGAERFLRDLNAQLVQARNKTHANGFRVLGVTEKSDQPMDVIVSLDENQLRAEAEKLSKILGDLDGKLSLLNATVMVAV